MTRSLARQALPIVAATFAACVVVQVFLAGLGVFDDPSSFITHRDFGYLFGWLTLVVLVLALLGRQSRRLVGMSALLLVLFALQSLFVALRVDLPAVAALHPVNGFAILAVGSVVAWMSWAVRREPSVAAAPAAPSLAPSRSAAD